MPGDWKRANVTPIYKAGNRIKAANYRPVSLTSQVGKLMEKLIRDEIVMHLEGKGLLRNSQHGFRKGRSCVTNLLQYMDKATEYVDRKESFDVIYLDFAKAFDKVPHQRLLKKIEGYKIGGSILRWIRNWLLNRCQRVCSGEGKSGWRDVLSGVPQGSVLGPVLFLIFIDDLDEGIVSRILKFEDDTKVFGRVRNQEERMILQRDLDKLVKWSEDWQMKFNVDKCGVLHGGSRNMKFDYVMNGTTLGKVDEEKDLGIMVRGDLKMSSQCKFACNKASRFLGMIRRNIENKTPRLW